MYKCKDKYAGNKLMLPVTDLSGYLSIPSLLHCFIACLAATSFDVPRRNMSPS